MSKIFFVVLLLVCNANMYSQVPRVQIVEGSTKIPPLYASTSTNRPDTIPITLQLTGAYDLVNPVNNQASFTINNGSLSVAPLFNNGTNTITVSLSADKWPGTGMIATVKYLLHVKIPSLNSRISNDEIGQIELTGDPTNFHTIRMSNSAISINTEYTPGKSFWVEVGANFDLIDGLEPNNFFSGVFFHKRDIRPLKRTSSNNVGIFAGIYESKTVTNVQEQNFSFREYYDQQSFINNVPDSLKIYKAAGTFKNTRVIKNVGLFFSPQIRLTNGSANADGLHFFTSLWCDLQWQKIIEDKEFLEIRKIDSFRIHLNTIEKYSAVNYHKERDIRSHYFGIGIPIFFRETYAENQVVHLFVNPVFGTTNQPTAAYLDALNIAEAKEIQLPERKWHPFYIVQFRLNEEKYGISFTGEVRGLIRRDSPPFVSLALSKKFDLTKFIEFNK